MSAVSVKPLFPVTAEGVIHNADGTKSLRWNLTLGEVDKTSTVVFSLQPDGQIDVRPDTAIGPWEKGTIVGRELIFAVGEARTVFAWIA